MLHMLDNARGVYALGIIVTQVTYEEAKRLLKGWLLYAELGNAKRSGQCSIRVRAYFPKLGIASSEAIEWTREKEAHLRQGSTSPSGDEQVRSFQLVNLIFGRCKSPLHRLPLCSSAGIWGRGTQAIRVSLTAFLTDKVFGVLNATQLPRLAARFTSDARGHEVAFWRYGLR